MKQVANGFLPHHGQHQERFTGRFRGMRMLWVVLVLGLGLGLVLVSVSACGSSDEEIGQALAELIPASYKINAIYFGEGLPISDNREDVESFYAALGMDDTVSLHYHPVSSDAGYHSIAEIQEATLAVYSESYSQYLFTLAFEGLSSVFNEDTEEQLTQTVAYARYLETDGVLTVRMNLAEEALPLNRTYDCQDYQILRRKSSYILVEVQSYVNGEKDVPVEVKLVRSADGTYRLDSPTY